MAGSVNKARTDLIRFENLGPHRDINRDGVNTETVGNDIKYSHFIPTN